MEHWGPVISFLLLVIGALLGAQVKQQSKFAERLEQKISEKVDDTICSERREACSTCQAVPALQREDEELWSAFNTHSHVGLPEAARVIR